MLTLATNARYDGWTPDGVQTVDRVRITGRYGSLSNLYVTGDVVFDALDDQPIYGWQLSNVHAARFIVPEHQKAFLLTLAHCTGHGEGYAFDLIGPEQTAITLRQCWAVQTYGQAKPNAGGFRVRNCRGLHLESVGGDHLTGPALFLESCFGTITHFWTEACTYAGTPLTVSNCELEVGLLRTYGNTHPPDTILLRAFHSSIDVAVLHDSDARTSGNYYTAQNSGGRLTVRRYRRDGATPPPVLTDWAEPVRWQANSFDWADAKGVR